MEINNSSDITSSSNSITDGNTINNNNAQEDRSQYNVVLVISLDPTEITLPPSNIQADISSNRTSIFLASNDEKVSIKEDFPQINENKSDDNDDPKNWSRKRKSFILFIISSAGLIAPFSSTIIFPALVSMQKDLNTSEILGNSLVSSFVLFMGIAPLAWASYSDTYATRRKVYLASILLYIIASILCGISRNIWLLLVMRALQACGGSSVQSLGVATISDTFHSFERGTAYGLFYVGPLVGPIMGPIFGGYLTDYLGWRWIFWFLSIIGGIIFIFIFFALPETFRHQQSPPASTPCVIKEIIEEKENIGNGNGNGNDEKLQESLNISSPTSQRFNPIAPLKLLRYPNVALTVIFVSVAFSLIYVVGTLLPKIFQQRYNLSTSQVGLVFLPPGIGYMLGSIFGGRYSDYVLAKSIKNLSEKSNNNMESGISNEYPELRLKSVLLGGIFMPIAYVMYGWFINYNINLIAPLSALFIGGASLMIIFSSTSTYLVDSFPKKSASVIAANNFGRSIMTALMSILAKPFEDLIGTGWLYTFMALLAVISGFGLVLVYYKGRRWRENLERKIVVERECDK